MSGRTTAHDAGWLGLGLACLAALAGGVAAQEPAEGTARHAVRIVQAAESTARAGDFAAARAALTGQLDRCPDDPAPDDPCRRVLLYGLGYIHQVQASRDPADRESLLDSAARAYQAVLRIEPEDDDATYNLALVYRSMGPNEWQEPFLQQAARTPGPRQPDYALMLGDYYRDLGLAAVNRGAPDPSLFERAAGAYWRAVRLSHDDPEPRQRLVALYATYLPDRSWELVEPSSEWEVRFPGVALEAVEGVLRTAYREVPDRAVALLPRWLELLARSGRLDDAAVERLPPRWDAEPVRELAAYLRRPYSPLPSSSWWLATEERRRAVGTAALELGLTKVVEEPRLAEQCWAAGREMSEPGSPEWLDLERELALLYFQNPALDPDHRRFRALEHDLFEGKAAAIGRRDWEAMQRFHTILGLIYAERGTWGADSDPRTANFQLARALAAADQRRESDGWFQPLPHLHERLADGLESLGRTRPAIGAWRAAALAAMDVDDLAQAAASIERGNRLEGGARSLAPAARALDLRQRVANEVSRPGSPDGGVCDTLARTEAADRARLPGLTDLPRDFVDRQLFKVLADCAGTPGPRASGLAVQAMLMATSGDVALVGVGDWSRLSRANQVVQRAVGQDAAPLELRQGPPEEDGPALRIAMPSGSPAHVTVREDAVLTARVVHALGPSATLPSLQVRGGQVRLVEPSAEWTAETLRDALIDIKEVRVRPR